MIITRKHTFCHRFEHVGTVQIVFPERASSCMRFRKISAEVTSSPEAARQKSESLDRAKGGNDQDFLPHPF